MSITALGEAQESVGGAMCQGKVKVPVFEWPVRPPVIGSIRGAGVAPGAAAQSRCDGVGSKSSRRKPSCGDSFPPGFTGPVRLKGFPVSDDRMLLVKLPSGGFGHINAKPAG